jgi:shikimate dehydrogenase
LNADVKASTRVYGIVGHPVSHSKSPLMQNAALRAAGIDGVYVAFHVEPGNLKKALLGLQAAGVAGLNITVPHKEEAARVADALSPEARRAGAVNTIAFREGRIEGHNTDGLGFVRAAERLVGTVRGKQFLLLGAGGAGRGVAAALLAAGAGISIANRTRDKAQLLSRDLALSEQAVVEWSNEALTAAAERADVIVNASSAGMGGKGSIPLSFSALDAKPAAIDLVYAPLQTQFLQEARQAGCDTQDGLAMLAAQGELAFEFWHEAPSPHGVMERVLRDVLA